MYNAYISSVCFKLIIISIQTDCFQISYVYHSILGVWYQRIIASSFSRNSQANVSELPEKLEEMS